MWEVVVRKHLRKSGSARLKTQPSRWLSREIQFRGPTATFLRTVSNRASYTVQGRAQHKVSGVGAERNPSEAAAIAAAASALEVSEQTITTWLAKGVRLRWKQQGVIDPLGLEYTRDLLHGFYELTKRMEHGSLMLRAHVLHLKSDELCKDPVFLDHWAGTPTPIVRFPAWPRTVTADGS